MSQHFKRDIMKRIVVKAWSDEAFLARLQANPREVLAEEGIDVPADVAVNLHFDSDESINLVVPTRPGQIEFSQEDIVRLAAARMQVVTQSG